jgi:hypothetical protein
LKAPGAGTGGPEAPGEATTEGAHLYNLAKDIGEKDDLADSEPEKVKELSGDWNRWNSELVPPRWRPNRQPGPAPAATKNASVDRNLEDDAS